MFQIMQALIWTFAAGLTMVIGGAVAVSGKKTGNNMLSVILGFSAGLLIYISFMELIPESLEHLEKSVSESKSYWIMLVSLLSGIGIVAVIDRLIPCPCDIHTHSDQCGCQNAISTSSAQRLYKTGLASMIAISLHNLPEGFATFSSTMHDLSLGLPLVLAIALHNVPEGLAISMPVYKATGSKSKAVLMSLYAGLCTPLGAVIGILLFGLNINDLTMGIVLAAVAGTMIFVALSELYPSSMHHGKNKTAIYSVIAGMVFMAVITQLMHHSH